MSMREPGKVRVGLDPLLRPWAPEITYALRTLLRVAGCSYEFDWAADATVGTRWDIYYGARREGIAATVSILASGRAFSSAPWFELQHVHDEHGLPFLEFDSSRGGLQRHGDGGLTFTNDIVFAAYWLLTGAREPYYPRDAHDLMDLTGRAIWEQGALRRAPVSAYGAILRRCFEERGYEPVPLPWRSGRGGATFSFSHDVDYPQIIKGIECLRLLRRHGPGALGPVGRVLRGTSHFWTFVDWIVFEAGFGARPTFYFMAHRGSLLQYAAGVPDAFYDIGRPEFRELFRQLLDAGAEIGLHASFLAHRSVEQIRHEKARLEEQAGVGIDGNRHHYFHVDPRAPHETLRRLAQAGLRYDASLAFDAFPGFRRGICHPFRPYHPGERCELPLVELSTAVMDDHFDRRLALNRIADPAACLRDLLEVARDTGGAVVVDYHPRGMNADFYPRYGPWLVEFARTHFDSSMAFPQPRDLARDYVDYERALEARAIDRTRTDDVHASADAQVEFGPVRPEDVPALADLHVAFFGGGGQHGTSVGLMGTEFVAEFFYGLNLDNPSFFVDVARSRGALVGFSVCTSDWTQVSGWMLRNRFPAVCRTLLRFAVKRPLRLARYVLGNLSFVRRRGPAAVRDVPGLFMLLAVTPEYRTRAFKERTGVAVATALFRRVEDTLRAQGCPEFWVVLGAANEPVNRLFLDHGATCVGQGQVQGVRSKYYRKALG